MKKVNKKIISTSYLVASCRATYPQISKDIYANQWMDNQLEFTHQEYLNKVSKHEDLCVSLRFRIVLDTVINFVKVNPGSVVVNFAAGLSSLCPIVSESCRCIEVDLPELKKTKHKFWKQNNIQNINFKGLDLRNRMSVDIFFRKLENLNWQKSLVFVFEGILYYLNDDEIEYLFEKISNLKNENILIVTNTWPQKLKKLKIFIRFMNFINMNQKGSRFNFFEIRKVKIKDFKLKKVWNYQQLYWKYLKRKIPRNNVLIEEIGVFEKKLFNK